MTTEGTVEDRLAKLEKENKELEKSNKLLQDKKKLSGDIADNYEKGAKYAKQAGETADEQNTRLLEMSDATQRNLRLKLDQAKLDGDAIAAAEALYEMQEELNELSSIALNEEQEITAEQAERIRMLAEEIEEQEKLGVKKKKYSEADHKAKKELEGVMGSIAKKSLFFTQANDTWVGSMFKVGATMREAHEKGELFTGTLGKYFGKTAFATSIVTKVVESTMAMVRELDNVNAQFAAATGLGDKYQSTLLGMRQEGNTMGVTMQNASNAIKGLTENMVGFVNISKKAQIELGMTVARFERIGIDANTSAQSINIFTLNMGKSEKQAMHMSKQLALMGQSAGISAGKMTKDFQTAFKSLAVYGDKSIEVFQGLASAARAAGVEVATLTSLAGKFDTFASSAETVGKLNALLGSQLSSTEMLMMTEDKRVETLVQQVQAQGVNFKDMNKFQQMAIANAAGISDMNEAQRIFGMSMKDYKKYQKDMQKQEDVQKRFNEAVEATLPIQEKFSILMANFAQGVEPVLWVVEGLIDGFIWMTSNKIVMGIISLVSVFYLLKLAIFGTNKAQRAAAATSKALAAAQKAEKAMGLMLAEQKATNTILSGKKVIENTVEAGSHLENAGAKNVSAAGSIGLGNASKTGGKAAGAGALGMLKFALAVLMIGAGVGFAAFGIAAMVTAFIDLANIGPEAVSTLLSVAAALSAAGSIGFFGAAGLSVAMGSFAAGLYMVSSILEDNEALQEGLENLALVTTGQGAAAMKKGGSKLAADIKTAVSAAMTQKLEVIIKLKDSALKDMVENVVVNSISTDGRVAKAVASMG